jgi:AcrR family transcriptional regulator
MTEVVAREGYAVASIAQAISLARVSRSTFYEHFADKLDCVLTLQEDLAMRAFAAIERSLTEQEGDNVTHTLLRTLVDRAERDPAGARVLLSESFAAGPRAMDQRDRLIERLGCLLEDAWAQSPAEVPVLDIPARVLVGGVCRLLSVRILRGASGLHGLLPDLIAWTDAYTRTDGKPRWQGLERRQGTPLPRSPHAELPSPAPPAPLPAGRHSLPAAYVSANQRERILHATVASLLKKGYTATTVADIVADAHLTRAVFYHHFRDKQEVLTEINQAHFQQMMFVTARGFFSAEQWPDRLWEGIHAAGDLNTANPALARIGLVETNAVGAESIRRTYELMMAFAVFLEEGYRRSEADGLPQLCSDAIAITLFELLYWETRRGRLQEFNVLIPHAAYIALAPFMGPEQADAFVTKKLSESASGVASGPPARGRRSREEVAVSR